MDDLPTTRIIVADHKILDRPAFRKIIRQVQAARQQLDRELKSVPRAQREAARERKKA